MDQMDLSLPKLRTVCMPCSKRTWTCTDLPWPSKNKARASCSRSRTCRNHAGCRECRSWTLFLQRSWQKTRGIGRSDPCRQRSGERGRHFPTSPQLPERACECILQGYLLEFDCRDWNLKSSHRIAFQGVISENAIKDLGTTVKITWIARSRNHGEDNFGTTVKIPGLPDLKALDYTATPCHRSKLPRQGYSRERDIEPKLIAYWQAPSFDKLLYTALGHGGRPKHDPRHTQATSPSQPTRTS
ncbi:hypothetical protein SELMODRAFT_421931 [Selaginella moellendorffii]|uniref:Uncharacterized protein n=1 Tax=Selaginella moellendorffii TaxID=88036 RepID=D8SGT6_SELML|nr:hypothetical protein SELMODRAFT_421931 [Selaginella moellendorffii]